MGPELTDADFARLDQAFYFDGSAEEPLDENGVCGPAFARVITTYHAILAERGFVIVPREPSEAMSLIGERSHCLISSGMAGDCYRAMISAAQEGKP